MFNIYQYDNLKQKEIQKLNEKMTSPLSGVNPFDNTQSQGKEQNLFIAMQKKRQGKNSQHGAMSQS